MKEIIIEGGIPLRGRIRPQGSKNAALPIIFASVATSGISTLVGVPDIEDVRVALRLIGDLGARIERREGRVLIDTRRLKYKPPDPALCKRIRASTYLLGACLARFGRVDIPSFGGCNFDDRPIDMHLFAAQCLGAEVNGGSITSHTLRGSLIDFDRVSVGATVNAIIMAAASAGVTKIKNAATEPHIKALTDYLTLAGADIEWSSDTVTVKGGALGGASVSMIPDMIEAGTYLLLSVLTGGDITAAYRDTGELEGFLEVLDRAGVGVSVSDGAVRVYGEPKRPIDLKTAPYPGYPTDLQPQMAPLMAKFYGGRIEETVWRARFGYLDTLERFGVLCVKEYSRARIFPSAMRSATVSGIDLRGTAAALLAALSVKGVSRIEGAWVLERGYEHIEEKLRRLGALVLVK